MDKLNTSDEPDLKKLFKPVDTQSFEIYLNRVQVSINTLIDEQKILSDKVKTLEGKVEVLETKGSTTL